MTSRRFSPATGFRLPSRFPRNLSVATVVCFLLVPACAPKATIEERIPTTVQAGGLKWTRGAAQPLTLEGLNKNFRQGASFVYAGMGGITVHVVEMKSEASAFDALQGWRTTPGMAPAQKGNLFFVVNFEQPDTGPQFLAAFLKSP